MNFKQTALKPINSNDGEDGLQVKSVRRSSRTRAGTGRQRLKLPRCERNAQHRLRWSHRLKSGHPLELDKGRQEWRALYPYATQC